MPARDEDRRSMGPVGRRPRHLAAARHPHAPGPAVPKRSVPRWRRRLNAVAFHVLAGTLATVFLVVGVYLTTQAVALSVRGVETTATVVSTGVLDGARVPIVWADLTWATPAGAVEGSVMDHDHSPGEQIPVLYDPRWADNVDNAFPLVRRMLFPLVFLGAAVFVGGCWFRFRTAERR